MTSAFSLCTHPQHRHAIRAFWQQQGVPAHQSETILPKGVVELIFCFQDPVQFRMQAATPTQTTPRCFVTGICDEPMHLQSAQQHLFFGVELHPVALKKLLRTPAGEFANSIVALELVDKKFVALWEQLAATPSFALRTAIAGDWIAGQCRPVHEQEMAVSGFLQSGSEPHSVRQLAHHFCYSPRQLHRKVKELYGMNTEQLIGYKRYVHSLQQLHHSNASLTSIAYDCHYFDQAHFIREFRSYTGLTPGAYCQQKSHLPAHLFQ